MDEISGWVDSLDRQTGNFTLELIVVSNSEWGESGEELIRQRPDIRWHKTERNLGFSAGNNAGLNLAGGDYIFFLNPDARVKEGCIQKLIDHIEDHPDTGMVGPATLDDEGRLSASVKNHFGLLHLVQVAVPGLDLVVPESYRIGKYTINQTQQVEVVNGSAMFLPAAVMKELGRLDERYFMYWEEHDLCYRLKQLQRPVWFNREAEIVHKGSVTTRPRFLGMEIEKHKSQLFFVKKYFTSLTPINRIAGILGYALRYLGALMVMNKTKRQQFSTIFLWYLRRYSREQIQSQHSG